MHLAKQATPSYGVLDTDKLSKMLQEGKLSIKDIYLKLCIEGASDGFAYAQ